LLFFKKRKIIILDLFLNLLLEHNNKRDTYYFFGFSIFSKNVIYITIPLSQNYKFGFKELSVLNGATKLQILF
jgi:hypothetical protein